MGRAGPSESRSSAFRLQPMALAIARTVWSPAGCAGANACILAGGPPGTHGRRLIASSHPSGMAWLTAADCSLPRLVRAVRPQGEQALVVVGSQERRLRRPISGCAGGWCFSQGLQGMRVPLAPLVEFSPLHSSNAGHSKVMLMNYTSQL